MRRRLFLKLSALCGSVLVAVLVVEAALRLFGLDAPRVWEPDPVLGWHHIPGARSHWTEEGDGWIKVNSLGYRDRPRQLEKTPGVFRVSVFGDSMTEGVQVNQEQTYTAVLEDRLSRPGRRVEILNHAINGYSPLQELLLFRHEASRYRPDLAVLAVFLDNDVADCHAELRSSQTGVPFGSVVGDSLRIDFSRAERSYSDYRAEPTYTARKYSAVYRFLRERAARAPAPRGGGGVLPATDIPKRYRLYLKSPPSPWGDAWATFERALLDLAAEARQAHIPLAILSVPAGQVVNAESWRATLEAHPAMKGADWDLDQPDRRLAEFAERNLIPLIQPLATFRKTPQDPPLFFGHRGHFTPAGHALMAQVVEAYLAERRLVPAAEADAPRKNP